MADVKKLKSIMLNPNEENKMLRWSKLCNHRQSFLRMSIAHLQKRYISPGSLIWNFAKVILIVYVFLSKRTKTFSHLLPKGNLYILSHRNQDWNNCIQDFQHISHMYGKRNYYELKRQNILHL